MTTDAAKSTFADLALWLVPTLSHERDILQQEMDSLRLVNADCASAPFPSHVTLIAGIEAEYSDKTIWETFLQGLVQWRQDSGIEAGSPLQCTLEAVTTRGVYFQCIVLALTKRPALISLNQHMRTTFALQEQPEYFPHCSLLYAPLSCQEALMQIDDMQGRKVWDTAIGEETIYFGSSPSARLNSITLARIELWDCNGPVSQWKRLESVQL